MSVLLENVNPQLLSLYWAFRVFIVTGNYRLRNSVGFSHTDWTGKRKSPLSLKKGDVCQGDSRFPRWGANLLLGQIFLKTAWKWRTLNRGAHPSFYYVDRPLSWSCSFRPSKSDLNWKLFACLIWSDVAFWFALSFASVNISTVFIHS